MPQNWKTYKLGELGTVVTGKTPSSKNPEHFGDATPFVTPTDFSYFHKHVTQTDRRLSEEGVRGLRNKLLPSNSLLVTCIGSQMGKVVVNRMPVVTNQQLNAIVPFEFVDADYLYYKLLTLHDSLKTMAGGGSTMPLLNKTDFENIEVTIPSLSEQQSIASILSALDDKIELNLATNRTLEQMAMALYKHWFVDFGPFQGGNFIESELGLIPEGWDVKSIEELSECVGMGPFGSNIKVSTFVDSGVPVISGQHLKSLMIQDDHGYNYITKDHAEKLNKSMVKAGDVIFTHAGNIGQVALLTTDNKYSEYILSQRQFYCRPNPSLIAPEIVVQFFQTKNGINELLKHSSSTGVPSISRPVTNLRLVQIAVSPINVQNSYLTALRPLFKGIQSNEKQTQTLTTLRDTLLPKLISGAIRVKDAERTVAHAL